jgi:hypothetical protein
MALPQYDTEFLRDRGLDYEVTADAGMTCVVFRAWGLPAGYDRSTVPHRIRGWIGVPCKQPRAPAALRPACRACPGESPTREERVPPGAAT